MPLGSPKSDTGTKSVACAHKQKAKVESMSAPGNPKMRYTQQVSSLRTQKKVTIESMGPPKGPRSSHVEPTGAPEKPNMRYMQQVRSLRT